MALILVAVACCATTGCGRGEIRDTDGPPPFRFFSARSFWNKPSRPDEPLDPKSKPTVEFLGSLVAAEQRQGIGPWIETTEYSVPIYTVPAGQPTVRVELASRFREPTLQAAWRAVPLPAGARPAAGSDGHLVVWQPSRQRMWEFWRLRREAGAWRASWGGAINHVSKSNGVYGPSSWPGASPRWGASASSLPLVGGLITLEDLEKGEINHALAIALPEVRARAWTTPAKRTDGRSTSPIALPEGAHLRLDPGLDLAKLNIPRLAWMIARAAQRYGIYVRDGAGVISFYAQSPLTGHNPYRGADGFFEGFYPSQILAAFPWAHLQLLKMHLRERGTT
jgi:hypothetical protein